MIERSHLMVTALNASSGPPVVHLSAASDSTLFVDLGVGLAEYDQSWFWTPEWQARHAEAEEDYREGRFEEFESMEEFLATL